MFGISTHLWAHERLDRAHLVEVAARGFDGVEVFASRTHFDYGDRAAVDSLAEWLDDTRLALLSMHAPIADGYREGTWRGPFSIAASDEARRARAVAETEAALDVAAAIPFRCLVVHAGSPSSPGTSGDTHRASLVKSLAALAPTAARLGVRIALEVIPNALSTPDALVDLLEGDDELGHLGVCMDVGHARLMGDVVDAIETCSGHLMTTHLHDNRGKTDDHLVPGQGVIDWDATLLALQKVGYDGPWIFEPAASATPLAVLDKTVAARTRLESLLRVGSDMFGEG